MSDLQNGKPFPAQYIDNGHGTALRKGLAFIFDATITGLASGAIVLVRFITGDAAIIFESGDITINQEEVLFEIYEDTTFTAPGTEDANFIRKMNRISIINTEIITYSTPVVDTIGEIVVHQIATGTAGQNVNQPGFGGGVQDASFVLKPNTEHLFKVTNNSALAVDIEAHYHYHEAPAKEYS